MFKKLFESWKQEWWFKQALKLHEEYASKQSELESRFDNEIKDVYIRKQKILSKLKIEEDELAHRLEIISDRKIELAKADNELRTQIKLLEAKASPTSVWCEAFTQGMSKSWDLMLPIISDNVEKVKRAIYDKATADTLERLHGNNKKNH